MGAVVTVSLLRGADAVIRHRPCQLSLFPDVVSIRPEADGLAKQFVDLVDGQRREEEDRHARHGLLCAAQRRLAARKLWGFPNLVRDPDGPWLELLGRSYDLQLSRRCWPAYYLVRPGAGGTQVVTVHARPGSDDTPAVLQAAAILAGLASVSIVPCTAMHPRHESS